MIKNEITIIPLQQRVASQGSVHLGSRRKSVIITFDDGYLDFFDLAYPILRELCVPATVFIVPGLLGQVSGWSRNSNMKKLMNIEHILELKRGNVGLGSHSFTHMNLATLSDLELYRELDKSYTAIRNFGEEFVPFSYPWGQYSETTVAAVRKAGYACAVSAGSEKLFCQRNRLFKLGRLGIDGSMDLDAFRRRLYQFQKPWQHRLLQTFR
jgi:peptidoglycan/xylan/chitin deacetylase (PgdA/CDA1 family)